MTHLSFHSNLAQTNSAVLADIIVSWILTPTATCTGIIIHHFSYVKVTYNKDFVNIKHTRSKQEVFFLYFGLHYDCMCNEIEYAMLEEYLARIKQKDAKEKESEKQVIEVAA